MIQNRHVTQVLFLFLFFSLISTNKITVWVDCDPGLDDTFAITLAGKSPKLHLLGVSTSAGNSNLNSTTRNALDILHNIGRDDVPVVRGSE
jgi:inosine-uridine nucleoside N-ribohydrolase